MIIFKSGFHSLHLAHSGSEPTAVSPESQPKANKKRSSAKQKNNIFTRTFCVFVVIIQRVYFFETAETVKI